MKGSLQQYHHIKYLLRHLLILILALFLILHLVRSTGKYLDDLIAVSSSAEHRVEFSFPAVSVCGVIFPQKNFSILKPSDILRPWILWAKQHFAVKDSRGKKMIRRLLFHHGNNKGFLSSSNYFGETAEDEENTIGNRTVWGEDTIFMDSTGYLIGCNTYHPPEDMKTPYGLRNMMILKLDTERIHPSTQYFGLSINQKERLSPFAYFGTTLLLVSSYTSAPITHHKTVHVDLHFEQFHSLSRPGKVCYPKEDSRERNNILRCTINYVQNMAPACLKTGKEVCSASDMEQMSKITAEMDTEGEEKYLQRIGCRKLCHYPIYKTVVQPTLDSKVTINDPPSVFVVFKAQQPVMTYHSEFRVYDFNNLAGDIGGMVGMLLGMSILAGYDSLMAFLAKWHRNFF